MKFTYGQKVIITNGFYKGYKGTIKRFNPINIFQWYNEYLVMLDTPLEKWEHIKEKDLKLQRSI